MTRISKSVALVLAMVLSVTGCHVFRSAEPAIQRWSGQFSDVRVKWSAEPGIDVMTGPVVPVRAYIESRLLAMLVGDLEYAYPGFTEAVPPNDPAGIQGANHRRPSIDSQSFKSTLIGNYLYHILSVQYSGRDVAATVCRYTYRVGEEEDNGLFKSVQSGVGESRGIYVERVILVAPPNGIAQPPPQAGFASAPSDNVFGGWQVISSLAFFHARKPGFEALWPTYDADTQACVDKAPDPPERRAFLIDGEHPRSDFPTAPPSPGWPEP